MSNQNQNQNNDKNNRNEINFNWWGISSVCCCILVALVIFVGVRTLMNAQRYSLASEALKSGNSQLAMAAMAPEIGSGLASAGGLFGGIGGIVSAFRK